MKKYLYLICAALMTAFFYTTSSCNSLYGQGTECSNSTPFCTASGVTYPAGFTPGAPSGGGVQAPDGPEYGCLADVPSPAWFYFQIDNGGDIQLQLFSTPSEDIDYAIWGPFPPGTTPTEACDEIFQGNLNPHDCSYSATSNELPEIIGATTGEVYIMIVTNYSNQPADLTIQNLPGGTGTGTTDCAIINDDCEVNLGADIDLCETDPLPTLDATRPSHDADTRYEWFIDGASQGAASTTATFTVQAHTPSFTPHVYKVVVTSVSAGANGCNENEDEIEVIIKPTPATNLTVFPNDSTLCSTGNAFVRVVNSQPNISYQILQDGTPFGGLVAGNGNTIQLPLTGLASGVSIIQVRARYTNAPTCTVTLTEQAQLTVLSDIDVDLGNDEEVICEDATIDLDGSDISQPANATYQWLRSIDDGISYTPIPLATSPTYTASETLPTPQTPFEVFYKLEIRIPSSICVFTDSVKIIYEPLPITNLTIEVDSVCNFGQGRVKIVNPEIGAKYRYQLRQNNAGVPGANIGVPKFSVSGNPITFFTPNINTTTKYFIEVKNILADAPCEVFLDIEPEVIVHPLPTAEFSGGANLCVGDSVELTVTMTGTQPFTITYRRDGQPQITTINNINSNTYTFFTDTAGIYRVTKIQDFFCENFVNTTTTRVNVNPNPKFSLGADTTLCDSEAPLTLTPRNPIDFTNPTFKWYRDGVQILSASTNTLVTTENSVGLAATTYEYILEVTNNEATNTTNCVTLDTILVTFTPNPVAQVNFGGNDVTGTTLDFCDTLGVQILSGIMPDHASFPNITYQWTDLGTNTVVGTNATLSVANFNATTDYELLVTDGGTTPLCENLATVTVKFIQNPVATISHDGTAVPNGGSLDFCFDEGTQTLDGVDPSHAGITTITYEWNDITNGIPLGNTPQIDISNPTNTFSSIDYELIVRDESNSVFCERTATMTVDFYPNPEAEITFNGNIETGNTLQFCDSDGVQTIDGAIPNLADVPTVTYQWTDLTTNTVVGTNAALDVDNFGQTTTYELLVSDDLTSSCERTAQITIQFIENPVAEISHDGTAIPNGGSLDFCFDDGAQILDGVHPSHAGLGTVTYKWNDVTNGIPLGNTPQISISNPTNIAASIDYELIVRDESNPVFCEQIATMTVDFYPNPKAEITFNGNIETGNTLQFCDSDGVQTIDGTIPNLADVPTVTYQWTDLTTNTVVGTNAALDVDNFGQTTTYELLVSDDLTSSCERTAQITIQFIENPVAEISHDGTAIPNGGSLDFCFDDGAQILDGVHPSHAGLGTVTYKWNDVTNGIPLGNTPQISISNPTNIAASIDYELIVRDESNPVFCEQIATMTVDFYPNPKAEITFNGNIETGNTLQFCDSDGVQTIDGTIPNLADVPTVTYQWTDLTTNTVVGTNAALDVDNFGQTTTYELLVSDDLTSSCERTAQITIQFIENPVAEISHDGIAVPNGGSLDFCFDDGAQTLDGVHPSHAGLGTATYEWTDITNGVPLGNTPQISVSNPTNIAASIDYELIVRDESNPTVCQSTTTITVNFPANPVAEIQFAGSPAPNDLAFCDSEGARTLEGALPSHADFGSVSYVWTQVGVGVVGNTSTFVTPVSNFSSSATYILEVISNDNPNLCSRTDEITIEFFPSPDTNISFAGNVVTELGFCTSEGAQTVTAPASPFYAYQWYRGTTANPLQTTLGTNKTQNVDNFATQGGDTNTAIYTVVVTDTRATCPAQSSIEVSFYAEPEIDEATLVVSASPVTHCVTGTSSISVTNTEQDVEYQLTRNGTPVASEIQTPTVDLSTITFDVTETTTLSTGQSTFIYGIQATRIEGFGRRCTQTLEDTATVIIYPEPTATVAGTATVCANEPTDVTFTITGNFPATLTYQVTDTFNVSRVETEIVGAIGSASPQTFTINTNTNTYQALSITDRYCSGTVTTDEAVVTTVHPPVVQWVEYDTAFCIDEPATFEVVGGLNHQYYINGLPVSTSNPYTIQANTLDAGTYEIYAKGFATANGCAANSDTITFIVHPLPVVDLGVDRIKCVDDITPLVATLDGSFIYDWRRIKDDGDIVTVGNGNDSLYVSMQGTYFVIVTNLATGCSDSSNIVSVTNYDTLDVDLGPDVFVCNPSSLPYRLVGSDISHQNGTTYEWYRENDNATIIGTDSVYDATEEGIYRVTAIDPRGCEARDTIRVNFTADPDFQILGHDNYACGEQDTLRIEATNLRNMIIDWQGNGIVTLSDSNRRAIVDVSGIYTVTVTDTSTIANCSVTKSVEVFVRPAISLTLPNTGTGDTTTLCQGDSLVLDAFDPIHDDDYTYRWSWLEGNQVITTNSKINITYNTTESFTSQRFEVKVTDPDGECFSTDTVNVRFRRKPIARITASDSVICIGESVVLQGGESFGNQFEWIRLPETASFATTTNVTVTPDSVGEFVYVLKAYFDSSTPCGAISDTIRIRVNRKAVANIEEDEIRLCENEQLEINAFLPDNPALTRYIWTHEENNLVLSNDSILSISFNEIQPISYEPFHIVLTVYDSLTGCDSTDRVLVKFNRSSAITIDSTYRTEVCLGDSVTLNARGATSYLWRKVGDTTALDSISQITVKLDTVGYHTFIVTGGYLNECQNTGDTAIIYVNPLPTIKAHTVDTVSICADDSITLYPSGGESYVWLNDPTAFDTITVSPKVPTNYIVMGTDSNGCQNVDTVHVYVTPTFELPELLQVCENETVMIGDTLNFADSAANTRVSYFWTETGDTTSFITVGESGTYTVEVNIDDCFFTRTTEVQVKEKPVLELVSDTTLCFELGVEDRFERGETHILRSKLLNKDSTTTYLYVWTDSTGQYLGNRDSLEIDAGGNYRLRVIARYDTECETNDSTFVAELCQPRIFIPEAFTPNNDNLNDNFEIFGKHIKNFEMQIFNRWSEVIYEVRAEDMEDLEPQDFWDGTHKGKNVPTGAYIWIIRYTDPFSGSTKQIQKTGSFMIVR
ncbi:gliding motility-associated C-terminal domain-containing protein [Bernardetia sp. OM2101]|uniref:gliding motility-associated C-terminal domain-containing protein n=1 Tax=Bernardetia sp. OM2101 TaxID=3344876 RepID=UPI0035D102DB